MSQICSFFRDLLSKEPEPEEPTTEPGVETEGEFVSVGFLFTLPFLFLLYIIMHLFCYSMTYDYFRYSYSGIEIKHITKRFQNFRMAYMHFL